MKFFSPTSELKELLLLQHIEKKPDTTQKEIANVISGAPSMVNVYIENLEEKKYLSRDYQSAKVVYYNITLEGIKRKNYLAITYFHELLQLYRLAEENIENFLLKLENKGYRNIFLYGAGEVAEIILEIIQGRIDKPLKVLAIVDDDKDRQGRELLEHKIISREDINQYQHDGIVITSYSFEDDIMSRLKEIGYPENRIERFFTE
ncbi:winged helix-turn-helix transcriptional regulator [Anaerosalibacter bizertensis]|uniref:Winged helix-turn-helix transcriptional regulator n=1 Tax=Anaerosalibacter bizertensis TaxID=932217 RepID=A0A9Q4ADZ6_9FIRM|nr:winged helix-turn-helix domain-containing protein [Anaerosalibacter bizertensis]MBV1819009.1 winged helix-turn-helix transcriptional regulator [Bacteroidales bacterium MSK.15.36]MCB5559717.1 winged helix-turn-helix transcriptional regulator [Anaerosalibacter bizertensis]MCG4565622.1 winged helix-turn-helix transcriptional regulator [Anaerosalibacter bizertensis]MCG4582630.1 winged helix-turn-helix transcriptional regulator [Anaerosalibacter bizertensis]MCG4585614.1 winged helix-turn-helix t